MSTPVWAGQPPSSPNAISLTVEGRSATLSSQSGIAKGHPIPPGRSDALNLRPAYFRPKRLDPRSCRIQSTKRLFVSLRLGHRCGRRRFVALAGSGERNKRIVEFLAGGLQFQQQFVPRFFWGWHLQGIQSPSSADARSRYRHTGIGVDALRFVARCAILVTGHAHQDQDEEPPRSQATTPARPR